MTDSKWRVYKQNLRTSEKLYKRYKNMSGWTHDSRFACEYSKRAAQQVQDSINTTYKMYNVTGWAAGMEAV